MNEGEKVTIVLGIIVTLMFVIGMYQDAEAKIIDPREYPKAFPTFQYFDDKYEKARNSQMLGWIPEPYPYFAINVNEKPQCNEWLKIDGQVPYNDGILMSALIGQYDYHEDDRTFVQYQNHPNEWGKGAFGYVFVPCGEGDLHLRVNYYYNPNVEGMLLKPIWETVNIVLEVQQ